MILVILFIGCKKGTNAHDFLFANGVPEIIEQYVESHDTFPSFTIMTDFDYNWRNQYKRKPSVYLIGPSFCDMFNKDEGEMKFAPAIHFTFKGHIIYIQSSIDEICDYSTLWAEYKKHSYPSQEYDGVRERALVQYVRAAILFQGGDERHPAAILSEKPDTLLIKKRIDYVDPVP